MAITYDNITHDAKKQSGGTSFLGYLSDAAGIELTVEAITVAFDEPLTMGDKVNFEWVFKSSDGEVFTVYDYKSEMQERNIPYDWHIGGFQNTNWKRFAKWFSLIVESEMCRRHK